MASRESQGLQVALILFVMLTVVLGVTSYVFFRKSEEKIKEARALKSKIEKLDKDSLAAIDHRTALKYFIGVSNVSEDDLDLARASFDEDMRKIEEEFNKDMLLFKGADEKWSISYSNLPDFLMETVGKRNVDFANATARESALIVEKQELEKREIARAEQEAANAKLAMAKQAELESDFTERREAFEQTTDLVRQRVVQIQTDADRKLVETRQNLQNREKEIKSMQNTISRQKDKLVAMQDQKFEVPDGMIKYVNQKKNIVWINLGSDDGLQRQTTFAVYDQGQHSVDNAVKKASIEVTKLIEGQGHLAEARILEDSTTNPILPGDVVHSVAWRPGRRIHFAFTGIIDITNNGNDDSALARNLVTGSGGIVDEQLTPDTQYFVQGKAPLSKGGDSAELAAYTNAVGEAARLGVRVLPVETFLSMMGYKGGSGVIGLGKNANPSDFQLPQQAPRRNPAPDTDQRRNVLPGSEQFKPRSPRTSAF